MAFFKFRFPGFKAGADAVAAASTESVDSLRRRARHRLIGAAVLVLAAVIGFPMLFDTQPRPVAVDVPIEIPDRAKSRPLVVAAPAEAASAAVPVRDVPDGAAHSAPPPAPAASRPAQVAAPASLSAREEIVTPGSGGKPAQTGVNAAAPTGLREAARVPVPPPKAELQVETKTPPKAQQSLPEDDGSRARALLDGKDAAKPVATDAGRFIVQVGAFSDAALARETRLKVERAGLTTYTQVAETKDGKRIRVRVGPFGSRAEADKAAGKIRALDLPAAILTL